MVLMVIALLASFVPSLALYFWLKKGNPDPDYQKQCRSCIWAGVLCCIPVILASFVFQIAENVLLRGSVPDVVKALFHDFIVLAFAEELVKYLITRKKINKGEGPVSWVDVMSYACIVGIGFGLAEDVVYAFVTSVGQILVRGLTVDHGLYGLLMGYFMGKQLKTGDKSNTVLALLLPTLIHGFYDFSLSEAFQNLADWMVFFPFIALFATVAIGIVLIVLIHKARKNNDQTYLAPLCGAANSLED